MDNKYYYCNVCKKEFVNKQSLQVHKNTITHYETLKGEFIRPFDCFICNMAFRTPSKLKLHQNGLKHIFKTAKELKKINYLDPVCRDDLSRGQKNKLKKLSDADQELFLMQLEHERIKRIAKLHKHGITC